MQVGAVVLATEQGLGYLARDFYRNGLIDKVFIVEHGSRKNHPEWYDNTAGSFTELLESVDTVLFIETPFNWKYIPMARNKGVKTVLMPMYECTAKPNPYEADEIITVSDLDHEHYPRGIRINVPVPNELSWKLREKAKVFVHNAGNGGIGGRNSTMEIIQAMQFIESPIRLIIRSQSKEIACNDPRVEIVNESVSFDKLWSEGDVFVFPDKFAGLSMPLQEAFASGMGVMCGDRFPLNTWLPKDLMFPVKEYKTERLGCSFESAQYNPTDIAACIDKWYNKDISKYSLMGKEWAKQNSWEKLKTKYQEVLGK